MFQVDLFGFITVKICRAIIHHVSSRDLFGLLMSSRKEASDL